MKTLVDDPNWGLVLAGGSGQRLSELTTDFHGGHVPKQYCCLNGGPTLLELALGRAESVLRREQIVVVVAEEHEHHWSPILEHWPKDNVIVQPRNRGTATGILFPLLSILERDPACRLALFPSDHYVEKEHVLAKCLRSSLWALDEFDQHVTLLGITPDEEEYDYGWILPGVSLGKTSSVRAFVEKPDLGQALELQRLGAVWNSFLLVASGRALIDLYRLRTPGLLEAFLRAWPIENLEAAQRLYESIQSFDFSHDILEGSEDRLRILTVPNCGWTDLGTPDRLATCLEHLPFPIDLDSHSPQLRRSTLDI